MRKLCKLSALAVVLCPALASADVGDWLLKYGTSVSAGGGFVQFTDEATRDYVSEGGGWEGRVAVGTKQFLAIEAAYVGSLHTIDALGLDSDAGLLGTTVESNLRINLTTGAIQPFFLAGAGWSHYSLTNTENNTSDVATSDNIAQFPFGIGVGYKHGGMLIDARAVYRTTSRVDMFAGALDGSLDSWSATVRAGFEY